MEDRADAMLVAGTLATGCPPPAAPPAEEWPAETRPYWRAVERLLESGIAPTTGGWSAWLQPREADAPLGRRILELATTREWTPAQVEDAAQKLQAQLVRRDLAELGRLGDDAPAEAVAAAARILERAERRLQLSEPAGTSPAAALDRYLEQTITHRAVPTGLHQLDRLIGGVMPGRLLTLGARPGVGKSLLALQIAWHVAQTTPVHYASLEMADAELAGRLLQQLTGIGWRDIMGGRVDPESRQRIRQARATMADARLTLDDASRTLPQLLRSASATVGEGGGLLIVDYLQLVGVPGGARRQRYEVVSQISHALKGWAIEHHSCVLAISALNRTAETDGLSLSSLRESDDIGYDSDIVMLMARERDEYGGVHGVLRVVKSRIGGEGEELRLSFDRQNLRFHAKPTNWEEGS